MGLGDKPEEEFAEIGKRKLKSLPPHAATLASFESLSIPLVQEIVLSADIGSGCTECQKRVAEILSKMNNETESVVISVLEKRVTLTCKYPSIQHVPALQVTATYDGRLRKMTMIKRIFRSVIRTDR